MNLADRFHFSVITGFGLGYAPIASGTFGTLGGVVIALLLQVYFTGTALIVSLWVTAAVLLAYGCSTSRWVALHFKHDDPSAFVLDEIVGYLVTLAIALWFLGPPTALMHGLAFFVFRATDILKLPPARQLEYLPGAYGIMLDDVAAGMQAGLLLALLPFVGLY